MLMTAPWATPQGPGLPPGPALLPLLPTTNLFWEPSPVLFRRPSLSPAVLPEAMAARFLSDSEPEAESASIHSEASAWSVPGAEGHAAFSGGSLTTAFLQVGLKSLVEGAGPRGEVS